MFADATLKAIKKLKDGHGRPLWLCLLYTSSDLSGARGKHEPVREREPTGASPKMPSLSDMRTK